MMHGEAFRKAESSKQQATAFSSLGWGVEGGVSSPLSAFGLLYAIATRNTNGAPHYA